MDRAAHDARRGRTERSSPIVIQGNQDVPVLDSTLRPVGHDHSQSRENMHAVPQVGRQAYHRTVIDKSTEVFGGDLAALTLDYAARQAEGEPVHRW